MRQLTIAVLGGSGFIGRHIVARLVSASHRVVVPTRSRERAKHLILLPTVDVVEADIHDQATLSRLIRGADAAINLVGILHERHRGEFDRVHVDLARSLVAACRASGVTRLMQMSALNADPPGPSRYLRSKGAAEGIVAESGLDWTVFGQSVIFGREDSFLNMFARLQSVLPVIPLACPGARFQPVFVGDVAHAFVQAIEDDRTHARRYALCGPEIYPLRDLVSYVGTLTGHERPILSLGPGLSLLQARVLELLPGPMMSRDNLDSMKKDSVCDCAFPQIFGITTPTSLEAIAPEYLSPAATRSRYDKLRTQSPR
jgi:NADH dehydrogenase